MVTHLGRLRVVTRRKEGRCRYKHCKKDNKLAPGDQVIVLTKLGVIGGKPTIYYKAYHPECFSPWLQWMVEQIPPSKDGRKTMGLSEGDKSARLKLVRERARILRALRTVSSGEVLTSKVERITKLDKLISETGYPVMHYTGRRSKSLVDFEKFIREVKTRYKSEIRVPKSAWDEAIAMGMEAEFRMEMDKWHSKDIAMSQSGQDYESSEEDKEDEVE